MQVLLPLFLAVSSSALPQIYRKAGQSSHQSVSKPYQGEVRSTSQAKAFGSAIASVASADSVSNTAQSGLATHLGQGAVVAHAAPVVAHPVAAAVAHPVVAHAAPLVHAAPAYHAPLAVAHGPAEVYPDEISPYTYNYAVADDYSASNFNAAESSDGTGNAEGSYSVNLPDGRVQHVNYHSDPINGFVADVTYDGTAVFPPAPVPVAHGVAVAGPGAPLYKASG